MLTTTWTVLITGLSLLVGAGLGAWLYAVRMRRKAGTRLRLPERWPLRVRRLVSGSEKEVWSWLRNSFPGHVVMVKVPVLRFTMLQDASNTQLSPTALADAQVERERWLELLNGVYSTFTLCTVEGKVVG